MNHGRSSDAKSSQLLDGAHSSAIVVELKSPDIPLNTEHLTQLKDYMLQIREVIQADHGREPVVYGHLIGNVPSFANAANREERVLIDDMRKRGPAELWEILPLPTMLERTRKVHNDWIEALEEVDNEAEGEDVRVVEAGSFSEAARAMMMTPSTVSKLIARLEARIGVRLIERSTRRLVLSSEGSSTTSAAGRWSPRSTRPSSFWRRGTPSPRV